MYDISFYLSLCPWTKLVCYYLAEVFPGCSIAKMKRPPKIFPKIFAFVGISDVLTNLNVPLSISPSISTLIASMLDFLVYRGSDFCGISEGSCLSSWFAKYYRSTWFILFLDLYRLQPVPLEVWKWCWNILLVLHPQQKLVYSIIWVLWMGRPIVGFLR